MRYLPILIILLASCYSRNKAQVQHGKAVATFPEIGADYCARTYPARDTVIKGETVTHFDTIYTGGETIFDTFTVNDTVRIIKTVQLPGTKIIERQFKTDTVVRVNTAEVDLWRIQANKALDIATDKTKEADKWKKIAKKRFWIIFGMGAVLTLGLVAMIYRKFRKKVPV